MSAGNNVGKPVSVLHTEWSKGWGGQEVRILSEMDEMRRRGVAVSLACAPDSNIDREARKRGFPVFNLPFRGNLDMATLRGLLRILRDEDIDIVNTHSGKDTWLGGLAARIRGRGFIRTRHLSYAVRRSRLNFINELAHHIVTSGSAVREDMIAHNRIQPQRITSIPSGPDPDRFDPDLFDRAAARARFGLKPEDRVIGIVAFLRVMKRHDVFLDVAKALLQRDPQLRFMIVGNGPLEDQVRQWRDERGLQDQVILTGFIEDPAEAMAAMDVGMIVSDRGETTTQVILQYMLMGLEVVTTDVGSVRDFLHQDNYAVVPIGDVPALADAVVAQLEQPKIGTERFQANRDFLISHFSLRAVGERMQEVYRKVLDEVGRG